MLTKLSDNIITDIELILNKNNWDKIFILVDENTQKFCLPILQQSQLLSSASTITIPAGDEHKNIETLVYIWQFLTEHNATRYSCMINLGGGVITDIGGFAACTFKRGMDYINIPTSLLGMVDAANGGKTGINFNGLKNEIGTFSLPKEVLISIDFLRTSDTKNLLSGFAEMVKHALVHSRENWNEVLRFDLDNIDFQALSILIGESIKIKDDIIQQDMTEQGIRKALNLGHTIGHALESISYKSDKPLLHGYAVINGLLGELYLSHIKLGFPKDDILKFRQLVKEYYGTFHFTCKQYNTLYELMIHDKKNRTQEINFTLLNDIGKIQINQTATQKEIFECLDYLREG